MVIIVGRDARLLPLEEAGSRWSGSGRRGASNTCRARTSRTAASSAAPRQSADDEEHLVVHRGERAFVLLNKFPYASGHLLVAPYRHGLTSTTSTKPKRSRSTGSATQGLAALRAVYSPEGFNLGWNIGRIAGAGHPRPRPPARRAALGRRHELHARARRRQGDPRASRGEPPASGRGVARLIGDSV